MAPTHNGRAVAATVSFIAAPFTAFAADGELELAAVPRQARSLVEQGVRGAFICGTTGEGPSLTSAERRSLAETWCAAASEELEIIVHVGHNSLREARTLAAHAQQVGARAIAAVAPYFFRPHTVAQLVAFCAELAAAAPALPFYYYHLPSLTNVGLAPSEFLEQARERIPTFAGIKFTAEEVPEYRRCVEAAGDEIEVFWGRDELLLDGLAAGARSAVGSTYNFAAPLYRALCAAFDRGDLAAATDAQLRAAGMIEVANRWGGLPALKAIMALTVDCGPCRLPLVTLDNTARRQLYAELDRLSFHAHNVAAHDGR